MVYDLKNGAFELNAFDAEKYNIDNSVIYFEEENKKINTGRIVLNLSTKGQESVNVSWQNYCGRLRSSRWKMKLQYRISETEDWKDVTDTQGRSYEFYTSRRAYSKNFSDVILPSECDNKERIQLSWEISRVSGSGKAPNIRLRKLSIKSFADMFEGKMADVKVLARKRNTDVVIDTLKFNHIPLTYVYPETMRLKIEGSCIRDLLSLELRGEDKACFSLSAKSVDIRKQSKNITITYAPKKAGKHKAELVIKTRKLPKDIVIPLEASCAKASGFRQNLIGGDFLSDKVIKYEVGLFSNKDYQFRMKVPSEEKEEWEEENEELHANIFVIYKWYRNEECLVTMVDEVKSANYCVPLQSPATANRIEITIKNNDEVELSDFYFGFPLAKVAVRSGNWSDPDIWEPKGEPTMEDFVYIEDSCQIKVTTDVLCSELVLGENVNIDINTGKMFYVSGDIVYGNHSYFTVHQNLLSGKWNYITSPINQAKSWVFSMNNGGNEAYLMKYNTGVASKYGDNWSEYIKNPNLTLIPGKGYAVYPQETLDVKYEGILCNSKTTVVLDVKNGDRWNLVGNPFVAPLSTKKLFNDIDGKLQGNAIFLFDRETMVYNPIIVDSEEEVMIPSLESFFVETIEDGTEITFKRNHQYIPKTGRGSSVNHNYLALTASIGKRRQYALVGMLDDSKYGFDNYDTHKMFGTSEDTPDVYFIADDQELSVNTFPQYPAAFDIGIHVVSPSIVNLCMDNLSVLPHDVSVILEDKQEGRFYDFCLPQRIMASLQGGTTTDRFRVYFNKAINLYEIHSECSGVYLWNDGNRILAYSDGTHSLQTVRLLDKDRKVVGEQDFDSNVVVFDKGLEKGRYTADILVEGIWIKDFIIEIH